MKTVTLVHRFVLIPLCFFITFLYVGASGQTLTVFDIPDQTINAGQSFSTINLDDYIDVPVNERHKIQWNATGASQLSVNIDGGRNASVVPLSGTWTGSETITFHATDTDMNTGSDAATFTIHELANAAPVVSDIPDQNDIEGAAFTPINLDNFVTDADNTKDQLTWSASGNSALSVDINPGTHTAVVGVPDVNWNGSETIVFKATDPESASSEDAATFTLTPVNDPPVVSDIPDQSINEGESFSTITLDNYVTDVDNAKSDLSWTVTGNTSLTPTVDGSRVATINQPANWVGSEKLTFTARDPDNASSSDDAGFEAKAVNVAPVAVDDSYSTTQGATLNIDAPGVLSNDSDGDGDPLTAIKVSEPTHGTVTLNSDGSFIYVNDGNPFTTDAFTYKASDGTAESNVVTVTINITLVNSPPVLGGIEGSTLAYTEGDGAVNITGSITVSDNDNANLSSAVITISSNYQNGEDVLSFTNTASITGSWNAGTGQLSLSGSASLTSYRNALRAVKYNNASLNPSTLTRTVTFRVNDGTDNSNTQSRNISVAGANNAPVLSSIEGSTLAYTEGDGAVLITGTIAASDADNTNLASAVIAISSNYQNGEDVLSFTNTASITGSWNASTGQLTLTGSASVASYRSALRAVRYTNSSASPSTLTRTVTFTVNDGTDNSNTQSRNISVTGSNSAPVLSAIEGSALTYTEGDGAVIITSTINATDADNTNLASAVIAISSNYQNGEDILSFTNTASITGSWNAATGQLTLSGSASVTSYRNALRAVRYNNSSPSPSSLTRTVTFTVNDGTDNSNTQSRNITVTGINSAPVLAAIESGALAYSEGDGAVIITSAITVTDADNTNLASAVIAISSNYQNGEDVLSFTNTASITGSWNASTGQLTLTGTASVASYRTALRAVRYTNSSATPSNLTRTVTFRVNDGTDNSNTQSRNITVAGSNSAPVLAAIEGTPLGYTEGDGAVIITSTITVADGDNTNLASAVIAISANYQNGEDVLSFTNTASITGSWNAATGQLTLSGSASVASYRSALRAVRYTNTSGTPSNLTRTVTFLVNDGTDNSNTQSRNITVVAFNSAPVLGNIETSAMVYTEGTGQVSITSAITVTDADDLNLASATITVSGNYQNGEDILSFTNANGITSSWNAGTGQLTLSGSATVANYQAALRSVKYSNSSLNPNTATRNVTFRISDGTDLSNLQSRNITITAVNNAPVLGAIETPALDYTEGDGPVSVTGTITVTDADNLTLSSAVVTIADNYKNPQDVLSFTNASGITGSWNATTGALTLSGNVSPANYQTALRSVKYTNNSSNPNISPRTVTFRVSDGTLNSNVVSRDITVTRVGSFTGSISGSLSYCTYMVMPITLTITDGTGPFTATLSRTGSVANRDTVITGIAASPYTINVKLTGSYELKSLTDANSEIATVSSTPVVLAMYPKPSGVLSGGLAICQDGSSKSDVTVNLSGTSPWTYTIRRGSAGNDTTLTGITSDPHTFKTRIISSPMTVRLVAISDAHCPGDTAGSGTLHLSYQPSPTATISGQDTICPAASGILKVAITGTPGPWNLTYKRDGGTGTEISIPASPYNLTVQGAGTYTLSKVQQSGTGGCTGRVSGTGRIIPYTVPTATLSGSSTFCEYATGNLNVALTGTAPWRFSYKLNSGSPVEVVNVNSSPAAVPINKAGTYTLVQVIDKTTCNGTLSGSANVTITPAPEVSLSGLAPAYDKDFNDQVPITGTPSGGTFSGSPGIFNSGPNWYFLPRYALLGPQDIVYSYRDGTTQCYGYDTVTVRVLEANAVIEFPDKRLKYCLNDNPFLISGWNLAENTGSFTISGGAGLVDHHDNTATIDPSQLSAKEYTITYTYFDGTTLNVNSTFEIGKAPTADFKWESECYAETQAIQFTDASAANFGNITAYHWKVYTTTGFDTAATPVISYTFPQAGNHVVELQVETSNGCTGAVSKVFGLRPTITPHLEGVSEEKFDNNPLSWRSASAATPTTNSWELGTPDGSAINSAYSGTTCWYTNIPATNAPREQSWVSSPCYDFSGMKRPMVKMQIWRDFNGRRDGAVLQATTDSSKSWFNIGQLDDGLNWFNEYSILGNPGNQSIGWSAKQDGGWIESRHSLDMLKGKTRVQFRIAYGSDGTVQNTDGFAFDDFWIGERDRKVLIEHFTNASDPSSQEADGKLNALVETDSLNTIDLQYHTSFPGDDPFNEQEPFAPSARLLYYGVSEVPYAILNGGYASGYRFDYDNQDADEPKDLDGNVIRKESLSDAKFNLNFIESAFNGNTVTFQIEVYAQRELPSDEYTIHAGLFEKKVAGTGVNGETIYRNVVRALLPDPAGKTYSKAWPVGGKATESYEWDVPAGINKDQLMAFVFIQNEENQEIYQVNTVKIGESTMGDKVPGVYSDKFIVFPNPASDQAYIRFDKPLKDEVRIEMYNNLGRLVYTGVIKQTDTDAEIKTDQYPDGLYIIRAIAGKEVLGVTKLNITR
jgi:hypothetical protein